MDAMHTTSMARQAGAWLRRLGAAAMLLMAAAAHAQSLPNGGHVSGTISFAGEQDSYTLTASAGENIQLRVVDTAGGALYPRITLYRPDGSYVTYGNNTTVGVINFTADASGTYTVVVSDQSAGQAATGPYRLYYVRAPGANEHGALVNGSHASGTLDVGDLDSYTLTASAGENIRLRVVDTEGGALYPRVTLYRPDGSYVTYGNNSTVGVLDHTATVSGTYTVVVSDESTGHAASGAYNLYYVRAPGAAEHGALINGGHVSGTLDVGDLDSYTLTASAGENIRLRVVDTEGGALYPRVTLYRPDGSYVTYGNNSTVGVLDHTATVSGTYTVVISDESTGHAATGPYNLYYVRTPGAAEHGPLVNGGHVSGSLAVGDLDSYTLTASVGENIHLRVVDTEGGALYPRVTLYRPDGSYVTYGNNSTVGVLDHTATVSGTYTVVVSDESTGHAASGPYNLHYARASGANEHGPLYDGQARVEQIELGDLDSYTFTANPGNTISLRVTDISANALYPRVTLYRPDGSYVTYAQGPNEGTLTHNATIAGVYTVIVSDHSTGHAATGNYALLLTGAGDPPPPVGGDGDVPLPLWALVLLAGVFGRSALQRLRR